MQFSHLCMCDKVNFSLYIIPFVKGLRLIGVNCLFLHSVREDIFIYMMVASVYRQLLQMEFTILDFLWTLYCLVDLIFANNYKMATNKMFRSPLSRFKWVFTSL